MAERKRAGLDAELQMKKCVEKKEVVDIIVVKYFNMNVSGILFFCDVFLYKHVFYVIHLFRI